MASPKSEEAEESRVFLNPSLHRKDTFTSYSCVPKSGLGRLLIASLSLNIVLLGIGTPLLVHALTKSCNVSSYPPSTSAPAHQQRRDVDRHSRCTHPHHMNHGTI